jgi:hypothetical protein
MSLDGRLLAGVTVFSATIEYGSFARAGEALGISASGVSHAIARLEMRMEVRLRRCIAVSAFSFMIAPPTGQLIKWGQPDFLDRSVATIA